jgi:tetratricopeptide (TPR) repeat protein
LWIVAHELRGWVHAADVVRLDQAPGYFSDQVKRTPQDPEPYLMRGLVHHALRDDERAVADFTHAVELAPEAPIGYFNRAGAWLGLRQYDRAITDLHRVVALDPKDADAYARRALVWAAQGDYDLAVADIGHAIRLDPDDPAKLRQRAALWSAKHEYGPALADYRQALTVDPNDPLAYNGLAWVLATAPDPKVRDGEKAVEAAVRAYELTGGKNPYVVGTLAAARAEDHDFQAAARLQSEALALFPKDDPGLAGHRRRLELYQAGKPYRDEAQKP